jgi:hypothetical protein
MTETYTVSDGTTITTMHHGHLCQTIETTSRDVVLSVVDAAMAFANECIVIVATNETCNTCQPACPAWRVVVTYIGDDIAQWSTIPVPGGTIVLTDNPPGWKI